MWRQLLPDKYCPQNFQRKADLVLRDYFSLTQKEVDPRKQPTSGADFANGECTYLPIVVVEVSSVKLIWFAELILVGHFGMRISELDPLLRPNDCKMGIIYS